MSASFSTVSMPAALLISCAMGLLQSSAPAAAQAQTWIHLHAGTLDAAGELRNAPVLSSPDVIISYGALAPQPALGLTLTFGPHIGPFAVRVGVVRSLTGSRKGTWGCAPDPSGQPAPCPAILIEVPTEASITAFSSDVLLDVSLGRAALRPLLGASYLRHAYTWDPAPAGAFSLEPGAYTEGSLALRVGGGVVVPVNGGQVSIEYVRHLSGLAAARPTQVGSLLLGVGVPVS